MKSLQVILICLLFACPLLAQSDLEAIIADRLEKIESMIKGGDANTAMGLLENLSESYPQTTAFHERAMDLALSRGAEAMANRVAHECLQRDPNNTKAKAVLAIIHGSVLNRSHHVKDEETFTKVALLIETNKRCMKLNKAYHRAQRRGKGIGPLSKSDWQEKLATLHKRGFLAHNIPCPIDGGSFISSPKGQIECPQSEALTLGLTQKKPVIEKKTLIKALGSACVVTRAHARQLLLQAKGAKYVLATAANHCVFGLSSYDQRELLLSLAKALKSEEAKQGRVTIANYCQSLGNSEHRDIRQLAAYVYFLASNEVGQPKLEDLKHLLNKDVGLAPAKDVDYLTALVKANRDFTKLLYRAMRSNKHSLPQERIIRSFSWCKNPKVIGYLIKRLQGHTDSLTYLALIETLQAATGQKLESPQEWRHWHEQR